MFFYFIMPELLGHKYIFSTERILHYQLLYCFNSCKKDAIFTFHWSTFLNLNFHILQKVLLHLPKCHIISVLLPSLPKVMQTEKTQLGSWLTVGHLWYFVPTYGLEALKMNMLSGAAASRLGGVGGSSSSDSSSSSSVWFASNSLLFTAKSVKEDTAFWQRTNKTEDEAWDQEEAQ